MQPNQEPQSPPEPIIEPTNSAASVSIPNSPSPSPITSPMTSDGVLPDSSEPVSLPLGPTQPEVITPPVATTPEPLVTPQIPSAQPLQPFQQPLVTASEVPTIPEPYTPPVYTPPSGQLNNPSAPPQWQPPAPQAYGTYGTQGPIVMGGNGVVGGAPMQPLPRQGSSRKKKLLMFTGITVTALLLVSGLVFGLYLPNTPSNVYSTSINRSGKAIDSIVTSSTTPQKLASYKASDISGTLTAELSGAQFSGDFDTKFDPKNLDGNLNITLKDPQSNTTKTVGAKVLSQIPSGATFPDVYFKLSGIKDLGLDSLVPGIGDYDGQWILVGSDYLKSLSSGITSGSGSTSKQISSADIAEITRTASSVTRKYVFSTDKNTAVLIEKKYVGKESIDGLSTYHYSVGVDIAHAKAYCAALTNSLVDTQAYKAITGASASDISDTKKSSVKDCNDSIDSNFKSTDTYDMWVDSKYKLIHKIRAYDKSDKKSYVDVGQVYTGGDNLSLFIDTHDESGKLDAKFTLDTNMKTNTIKGTITYKSTSTDSPGNLTLTLTSKVLSSPVTVTKPVSSTNIQDVLNKLGLGSAFGSSSSSSDTSGSTGTTSVQGKAKDTRRQTDIQNIQTQLEAYFQTNGNYPSLADLNNSSWRKTNMASFDDNALQDPDGNSKTASASPAAKTYAYQPLNAAGTSCESSDLNCVQYTLTATLDAGGTYVKKNLD